MIEEFSGEHRWLSNFWPSKVKRGGLTFDSVETAYQSAKFKDDSIIKIIHELSPGRAKRYANACTIGRDPDFHHNKLSIMEDLLRQKFRSGSALATMLLATGDVEIVEGNTWGDTFWGVCQGVGENNLGKLLMQIRDELAS